MEDLILDQPESEKEEITVPVKFNKEVRQLSLEDAATLAQKGLKFETIEEDFNTLKSLAAKENQSVPVFIAQICDKQTREKLAALTEECGGNEELAARLLKSEGEPQVDLSFEELNREFPQIKSEDDLPKEVIDSARLKGTLLLDEYLRYLLSQKKKTKAALSKQKDNELSSTGSLNNLKGAENPETEEFLRGLWK